MRELRMFMILLGNILSHAVKSESTGICDDKPEAVCVADGGSVMVPCPNSNAVEVKYRLLQGRKVIYNHTFSRKTAHTRKVRADLKVVEDIKNNTFSFQFIGVNSSHHDIYSCEGDVIYPPPMGILQSNNTRLLLLVDGHQCNKGCKIVEVHCAFTWISVVAVISAYALFVSIFAVVNWVKLRQTDTQSDYVNTKPSASRGCRR